MCDCTCEQPSFFDSAMPRAEAEVIAATGDEIPF
jgi:hypothetical protein